MPVAATTTLADQWFTLADDWTVADCGPGVLATVAQAVGTSVWVAMPGSENQLRPIYEAGFKNGMSSGVVHRHGTFTVVETVVRDEMLLVSYQTMTANGLRDAVEAFAQLVELPLVGEAVPVTRLSLPPLHIVP